MTQASAPGWYRDPTGSYEFRYWDGSRWTNQVSTGGTAGADPNPLDLSVATTPPAPGSAAPGSQPGAPPQIQVTQKGGGSSIGSIVGVILGIVAIVILIFVLMNLSGDDDADSPTEPPATTEAPSEPPSDS
jgi:hypothetical protein